jgi:hypothetical protein
LKPQHAAVIANSHLSVAYFPFFLFEEDVLFAEQSLAGDELNERKTVCRPSACNKTFAREKMDDRKTEEMPSMRFHKAMEKRPSRRNFWKTAVLFLQGMWIALFHVVNNPGKFFFSFSLEVHE